MTNPSPLPDPFELLKKFWAPLGVPVPGIAGLTFPTTNVEEIDKRIAELRTVENWLTLNLDVLKTTIQALETQKATLSAFQSMQSQAAATFNAAAGSATADAKQKPRNKKVE